jgi:hypothetical protein
MSVLVRSVVVVVGSHGSALGEVAHGAEEIDAAICP